VREKNDKNQRTEQDAADVDSLTAPGPLKIQSFLVSLNWA
jgi:hypothetical protein